MSKYLPLFLKSILVIALFAYLIVRALHGSAFNELSLRSTIPSMIALGFILNLAATVITILRWRELVNALDITLSMKDAMKLGFIGFMFNLSPIGIVGGDAVKIYLLHKKANAPVELAVASVVVDRVVGLYVMFILGLAVVAASGFYLMDDPTARFATNGLILLTVAASFFILLVAMTASEKNKWRQILEKTPALGKFFKKAADAACLYRRRKDVLIRSVLATVLVHSGFSVSLYAIAKGLFQNVPSILDHFILYCVGNVGSIVPLSAGPLEYFLDELYPLFEITGRENFQSGHGMTIGIAFRLAAVAVALVGVAYYLFSRNEVRDALDAANENEEHKK